MSDTTAETTDEAPEAAASAEENTTTDPRITKANAEAARYRKEARAAQAELEKVRQAGLSEQEKAIAAAIKKLGGGKPADFDGGARTTAAKPADMNSLIRQAAGRG